MVTFYRVFVHDGKTQPLTERRGEAFWFRFHYAHLVEAESGPEAIRKAAKQVERGRCMLLGPVRDPELLWRVFRHTEAGADELVVIEFDHVVTKKQALRRVKKLYAGQIPPDDLFVTPAAQK